MTPVGETSGGSATVAPSSHRVTLADVAKLAEVSIATASKALSGRQSVSVAAKQRVAAAAEQLNFRPNRQAQGLALGRSGTVGLVTHDLEGRFSIPILVGAEDAFGVGKVSVMLCDARGDAIREEYHINALLGRQVDGLIVVGARPDPRPSLGSLPVPVVYAYASSADPRDMSVVVDNRQAGQLAIEHLLACGRRKIAVISGDASYGAAKERVCGAMDALAERGLEMVGKQALYGAWSETWGRGATRALLERFGKDGQIDAILGGSDQVARGALDALREAGLRVPEEIAVVGHDNWQVIAAEARPPLTSVDMNLEDLGHRAAARLMDAMDGRATPGLESIKSNLVVRGSTAV